MEGLVPHTGVATPELLAALTARIDALLAGDPDRLRQALYRIDIPERAARAAAAADRPAAALAALVLQRVQEKAALRAAMPQKPVDDADLAW